MFIFIYYIMKKRCYNLINIIYALLFSFSANIDNIAIGMSYGIKKCNISIYKNIVIAAFTCFFTFISMYIGKILSILITENLANIIGGGILILLGLYTIFSSLINKNSKKTTFEDKTPNVIDIKDLTTIIFLLSLNNVAAGLGASVAGISIVFTTFFTFIFSIIFIQFGNTIGIRTIKSKFITKYSDIVSAFILILIGIFQL